MKKHSYRQIDVKQIEWDRLRAQTENHVLHFCADVAKQKFVGLLPAADGDFSRLIKWRHPLVIRCRDSGHPMRQVRVTP